MDCTETPPGVQAAAAIIPREDRINGLHPNHLADLRRSGLSDDTIKAAGITSEHDHRKLAAYLNRKRWTKKFGAAMVLPYRDEGGDVVLRCVKPDNPPLRNGKPQKYLHPTGTPARLYTPPGAHELFDDTGAEMLVTEGIKKALAGTQEGFPTIGLTGVENWHQPQSSSLLPDLSRIRWTRRKVYIVFDSDAATNEQVETNERCLAAALGHEGAIVKVARIPPGPNGEKVGLDDFLVAHGKVAFRKLLDEAEDPEPPSAGEMRESASQMFFENEARDILAAGERDGLSTVRFYRGDFMRWAAGAYAAIPDAEMRARVTSILSQRFFKVAQSHTSNVLAHIAAQSLLPDRTPCPSWIGDNAPTWNPVDVLVCRNAIIHLPSIVDDPASAIIPPTPKLLTMAALDFDFLGGNDCPESKRWFSFLAELWPDDPEAIEALQLWFGYCLTQDTRQQKMLALIGPKRSGKGTIVRVLQSVIGRENCASPTLASFATNFGLSPLIDKTLAVIADARFSGRADAATITERLLSITGEDMQTIDRKHRDPITLHLPVRIMLVSNELPRLQDSSGALAGRLIVLQLTRSWFGREDHHLTDALLAERQGILLWAIQGWQKLRERGRLLQPASGGELLQEAEDLLSPISVFVRDCCDVGPEHEVSRADLYGAYSEWAKAQGKIHVPDEAGFGRDLRASLPTLRTVKHRASGGFVRYYGGVSLRSGGY